MSQRPDFEFAKVIIVVAVVLRFATSAVAQPDTVQISFAVTQDWGSGFQAAGSITNNASWIITDWRLEFDWDRNITSIWDARIVSHVGNHYVLAAVEASWEDGDLSPGEAKTFGFVAQPGNGVSFPVSGLLNGATVSLNGVSPAPPPPPPVPAPPWPTRASAPYVDATNWPPFDYVAAAQTTGSRFYSLGFIVGDPADCSPSWGTYYSIGSGFLAPEINALRSIGGDVSVSFGGAANTELALCTADVVGLKNKYRAVVDTYGLTHVDFDIEGAATADAASVDRRSRAIAMLQAELASAGRTLHVSLTLPVLPSGLTADGVAVVASAVSRGVNVGVINVMAMDYGDSAAPNPDGQMGAYAIQAATSTKNQVKSVYASVGQPLTDAQAWRKIGVTPMIGLNDIVSEKFRQADAQQLVNFATQNNLALLAFWSANRDKQCPGGAIGVVDNNCSSILQQPFEFTNIFKSFSAAPAPPGDMNCDGTVTVADAPALTIALIDPVRYAATYSCDASHGDINADQLLNGADIAEFVGLLLD